MSHVLTTPRRLLLSLLVVVALVGAACGGGDDDQGATESPTAVPEPADPTTAPEPDPTAAPEPEPTEEPEAAPTEAPAPDPAVDFEDPTLVAAGMAVFEANCVRCHGADGAGTTRGKALTGVAAAKPDPADQVLIVELGQGRMPSFGGSLTPDEINAVVAYVRGTFV